MDNITILSIDPSLRFTALYCSEYNNGKLVYKDDFLIETEKTKHKTVRAVSDTIKRCNQIITDINNFNEKNKPDIIFVETPTGSQSANGMKSYGIVCMLIAALKPSPIELTPTEVKKSTVGNKNATKAEMIKWSYNIEPNANWIVSNTKNKMNVKNNNNKFLTNKNEHLADAIAVAYTGIKSKDFNTLINLVTK